MQQKLVKIGFILIAISFAFLFWRKMNTAPKSEIAIDALAPIEADYIDTLPADFYMFYDRFHSDSVYQIHHIEWPLKGLTQVGDSTLTTKFTFWEREGWKLHKPFDSHGGTFERSFTNDGTIITEDLVGNGGMFSLQKQYRVIDGQWHLVYYQGLMMHG